MPAEKDTVTYELQRGAKVVYIGTTKDTDDRTARHHRDGKILTSW